MQCINPVLVTISDKNSITGSRKILAPCGKCPACFSRIRSEWQLRLQEEYSHSENSYFITLTYSDENLHFEDIVHYDSYDQINKIDTVPVFSRKDISSMMKRLRKRFGKSGIRFFIAGEYGPTTFRPHYHGLLFNLPNVSIKYVQKILEECWRNGFVSVSRVTPARVGYVAKYINTFTFVPDYYPRPPICSSRNPAIGHQIVSNSNIIDYCRHTKSFSYKKNIVSYGKQQLVNVQIPRLFRKRMFSEDEYEEIKQSNLDRFSKLSDDYNEYKKLYNIVNYPSSDIDPKIYERCVLKFKKLVSSIIRKRNEQFLKESRFIDNFEKRAKKSHKYNK